MATDISEQIGKIWDHDASHYDSENHAPQRPQEIAAWRATLRRLLPDPPARILDVGAGTGFLSLMLADLGYRVTALDLSAEMLGILTTKAERRGLAIQTVHAEAASPPADVDFDAVIERHVIWTLPDPDTALAAWRKVAPDGRLVLLEGTWRATRGIAAFQTRARALADRIKRPEIHEHDNYPENVRQALPYPHGLLPAEAITMVESSPWGLARLERLLDIERAVTADRGLIAELLGTAAQWAVTAGS